MRRTLSLLVCVAGYVCLPLLAQHAACTPAGRALFMTERSSRGGSMEASQLCDGCREAVHAARQQEVAIRGALVQACDRMPESDTCHMLAAEVLQRYIYDTDGSTSSVCDVTGFCGLDTKQELQSGAAGASLTDATPCDKCRMTVLEFRMVINNPTVQSEIVNVTFTLCDHVAPYQQQCREYVTKYAPVVFDLIRKNFQPDYVCKALLLCQQPSLWKHLPAIGPGNAWNSLLWLFGRDDNQHRQQQR
uniref:Saposin B-type domain-containing protein n=1 Tax=Chlamydomonas euryale TaxID=1486919 RepID=A0A7R9V3H4_9CHLO|mmetsp:Transcript_17323/g.52101  ORF Transcript_17323/g.52101 Transcript_17323/m.52101 type:complete len:247 (+) Transcript_17323:137-877(+)